MRISSSLTALALLLAVFAFAACRAHAPDRCFPERGTEVWVERHYPRPAGSSDAAAPGSLDLSLIGDPGEEPAAARQAIVAAIRNGLGGTSSSTQVNARGVAHLGPLTPGAYTIRLREILYVGIERPVDVGPPSASSAKSA